MINGKGFSWECWCKGSLIATGTLGTFDCAKEASEAARNDLPREVQRNAVLTIEGPRGALYRLEPGRRSQMVWRRI